MPYAVKSLACDPSKLEGLSEKLIVGHYVSVYCNTVKRLNVIADQLSRLDLPKAPSFLINALKREELAALNSMVLHEIYFESLGGSSMPSGELIEAMQRDFGGFEPWHAAFASLARAQAGRAGWVTLAWFPRDSRLVNLAGTDLDVNLAGGYPVLALDMHEHAYQMDYGMKAVGYIEAFMKNINWERVTRRYRAGSQGGAISLDFGAPEPATTVSQ